MQRLKFFFLLNSERGLWYDGMCGWFEISIHQPVTFESNQNRPNRISKLRRSLRCYATCTFNTNWSAANFRLIICTFNILAEASSFYYQPQMQIITSLKSNWVVNCLVTPSMILRIFIMTLWYLICTIQLSWKYCVILNRISVYCKTINFGGP